jgi:hypothetical protein
MANEIKERTAIKEDNTRLTTADVAEALDRPDPRVVPHAGEETHLLIPERSEEYRSRWTSIQTGFVDEPRHAVEQADSLVAEVMQELTEDPVTGSFVALIRHAYHLLITDPVS